MTAALQAHPVDAGLDAVRSALTAALGTPPWSLDDQRLTAALTRTAETMARVQALLVALIGEADARGVLLADGAPTAQAWLRHRLRLTPGEAGTYLATARAVRSELSETTAACRAGRIGVGHAAVVARTMAELPPDPELRRVAEADLLRHAETFDPVTLAKLGRRMVAVADPDAADARDGDALARAEERAAQRAEFSLVPDGEGGSWLRGRLDPEGAAVVRAALDPLSRPRPAAADGPDRRPPGRRRAEALVEVCRRALATGELPASGGERPHLVVTVPLDVLRGGLGSATLDDGTPLSATAARRLACDAEIIPAVLAGAGEPLDVGRGRRLFTGAVRRALMLRDRGCAFPGCDRPVSWCEAHHVRGWAVGGSTALDNGVLLCRHHHRLVEAGEWQVRLSAGRPEFIPPAWVDPDRRPLRNHLRDRPD